MQTKVRVGIDSTLARVLAALACVVAGVGLLTTSAWVSVPFFPVPMTMQTLAVLLIGGVLGPKLGVVTVASYLALGMAGAPVFHNGLGGVMVLLGPTGGYLVGFMAMAAVMGLASSWARRMGAPGGVRERGFLPCECGFDGCGQSKRHRALRQVGTLAGGVVLAEVVLYLVGASWLAAEIGAVWKAVEVGVIPFLVGDALKGAVAIAALQATSDFRQRLESPLF